MSESQDERRRNQQLKMWAILWVIGSFVVAITVAVVFLVSGKGSELATEPRASEPSISVTMPSAAAEVTRVLDETPKSAEIPVEQEEPPPPAATLSGEAGEVAEQPRPAPVPLNAFGYGIQVHGAVGEPVFTIGQVKRLGLGWIKQQVRWGDMELSPGDINWGLLDGIMAAADEQGVRVMLSIVTAPQWSRPAIGNTHGPPDDLNQYIAFVSKVIDRYPGQISAIEVWNEQNLQREWHTVAGLDAGRYVEMLRMAYQTIKEKDPDIVVISGALSPTGGWVEPDGTVTAIDDFSFFQQLLEQGMLGYADCVGAHHNGYNIGPDVTAEDAPNTAEAATATFRGPFENVHHSWSFRSTLWGYYEMMAGAKKLCVTEFGWASTEGTGGTPAGFSFADDNSLATQADWIVQAFELQRQWGITWLAFLWNLDFGPKGLGPEDNNVPYSILHLDGSPRPAFEALEMMPKP
jgi:polysaccharide biosynthesis protein PslG